MFGSVLVVLLILSVVQGIAEFLPISSSGHLVVFKEIAWIRNSINGVGDNLNMTIDVALHVATLVAVLIYLRKDIATILSGFFKAIIRKDWQRREFKISTYIVVASIPVAIVGFTMKDYLENLTANPSKAALFVFILLIFNGIMLISTKKIPQKSRTMEEMGFRRSFIVGIFQSFAILPGISRSGSTIAGGLLSGLEPLEATRFSILIALPAVAGAGLLKGMDLAGKGVPTEFLFQLLIAMAFTVVVALFALKILFSMMKTVKLDIFGYYTIALGVVGIILLKFV